MKKLLFLCCCGLLSSCYAFLQADKLVYSGTIAKQPKSVNLESDSTSVSIKLLPAE